MNTKTLLICTLLTTLVASASAQSTPIVAGTLHVDLKAGDFNATTGVWANRAPNSPGDFTAYGAPTLVNNVNGTGLTAVQFSGVNATSGLPDAFLGPVAPADITGNGARSVEVWALDPFLVSGGEQTLVAWGHRGTADANQTFGYSTDTGWGASAHWGDDMGWGPVVPKCGVWHHLVYTYDGNHNNNVYCDGALCNSAQSGTLATFVADPILLGAQSDSGGGQIGTGQPLMAFIAAVRIESGTLTPGQVLTNYLLGINPTAPGAIQKLSLSVPGLYYGGYATISITANFANKTNIDVTRLASLASSATNVVQVLADNSLQAVGHGSATISASFWGANASQTVAVVDTLPLASLIHRYSFSEAQGATNLMDSVGSANGTLVGPDNASFSGDQLTLPGGNASGTTLNPGAAYVDLPNGLISGLTNVTVEAWVTWNDFPNWERVFDFGSSVGGEDFQNGGVSYLMLTPQNGSGIDFEVRAPEGRPDEATVSTSPLPMGVETHVVAVYNHSLHTMSIYTNGILAVAANSVATVPLNSINDINDWLGRSQFPDPFYNGSYDEFRIYDGVLSSSAIAGSYVSGAATPGTNPGALQAVHLTLSNTNFTPGHVASSAVTADFAQIAGVVLLNSDGVTYQSANTNVASVSVNGTVTSVGPGTTTITATYQSKTSNPVIVTVNPAQGIAVAGTLYVDLKAADFNPAMGVWNNRAPNSPGDFTAYGAPTLVTNVNGTGLTAVQFSGVDATSGLPDAFLGPVPASSITGNGARSIEVWALDPSLSGEETLVAWGHRGTTDANQTFGYSTDTGWGASAHWGDDMGWGPVVPQCGVWHYLVYTYDGNHNNNVYCDGALYNSARTGTLATFPADPILLGAQSDSGNGQIGTGQPLTGLIAAVRVGSGALNTSDILNNYLEGPNASAPGSIQSISITVPPLYYGGFSVPTVWATFANKTNINVSRVASIVSGSTNVVQVLADNSLQAVGHGSATITASFLGVQSAQTVAVVDTLPPAQLVHRYSFSEAQGATNLADSVGGANGILIGAVNATLTGTQLTLPGGPSDTDGTFNTAAAYASLPGGLISSLTNVSFEAWVTWNDSIAWERLFDFGDSVGGAGLQNGGTSYFLFTPQAGDGSIRTEIYPAEGRPDEILETGAPLPQGVPTYVAVVYDYSLHDFRVYTNGMLAASMPTTVPLNSVRDINDWLGRSQYNDPYFLGSLDEFRIWNGVLSAADVSHHYAAGPNTVPAGAVTLQFQRSGANIILSWTAGTLLQSANVAGPYTAVSGNPQSPYTVSATQPRMFYRVQLSP